METWKPVLDFEQLYEVSNLGNVRRVSRGKALDAAKIPEAKRMFEHGATLKQVAEFLGTSIPTAHSIKLGKTWAGNASFRPLKPRQDTKHYLQVDLVCQGKYARKRVHRMVWEAFNGRIESRLEINHKDLDRTNNQLDNLEITTHRQNIQHAIDAYKAKGLLRAVKGVKGFISGKHSKYNNTQ
jgi:hypothetical protein